MAKIASIKEIAFHFKLFFIIYYFMRNHNYFVHISFCYLLLFISFSTISLIGFHVLTVRGRAQDCMSKLKTVKQNLSS